MSRFLLLWVLSFFLATLSPALAQVTATLPGLPTVAEPPRAAQVVGVSDGDEAIREKLKRKISVDWIQVKLNHAVDELRRELDMDIQLDPEGLEEASVVKDQEIEQLACRNGRGDQVLRLLLEPLHMTYIVRHGVVMLTSEEKASEQLSSRAYNVRDLLEPWPARNTRAAVAAGPLPVPQGTQVVWSKGDARSRAEYHQAAYEIIDLITSMVAPDSWSDNGGAGSISMYRGLLVVSQTEDVHSDVDLLLRQLRAGEKSQPGDVIQFPE
jgi:hypothetical protein